MIIHKAYKYRLYPTKEQEQFFAHHFGCVRFVYNHFLNLFKTSKQFSKAKYKAELPGLKNQLEWLKFPNSQSLQSAIDNLGNAICRFRKGLGGFPVFKKRNDKNSFEVPQFFELQDNHLYIPKLDSGIKIVLHRPIGEHPGMQRCKINNLTITKIRSGKYFASFSCELEVTETVIDPQQDRVGVDVGLKDLAVGVNQSGDVKYRVPAPRFFRKSQDRIARLQQVLATKEKGSNNWKKIKHKIAVAYEKVSNCREDLAHQLGYRLTQENQFVAIESLNVSGMLQNHSLAKSVQDAAIRMLHTFTAYKGEWYGALVQKIAQWFPSTKLCWACGTVNHDLTLSDREWTCQCEQHHDRDVTAARNILNEGLRIALEQGNET